MSIELDCKTDLEATSPEPLPMVEPEFQTDKEKERWKAGTFESPGVRFATPIRDSPPDARWNSPAAGLAMIAGNDILPTTPGETRPATTRTELWAYYAYYAGNSGLGPFNFGSSQMQDLMYLAGYDPAILPAGFAPCGTGACYLPWAGGAKPVTSVILDVSGIQFAIQVVLLFTLGSYADFGSWRRAITAIATTLAVGVILGWLGCKEASSWQAAVAINIMSLCLYTVATNFFLASMPGLTRDLPEIKKSEEDVKNGIASPADHATRDMIARNRVADYTYAFASFPPAAFAALAIPIVQRLNTTVSDKASNWGYGVLNAYCNGCTVLLCIPWVFCEQKRPGMVLPPGKKMWNVGFFNLWEATKNLWKLKQTLIYLIAVILTGDALNTASTFIFTMQYEVASYDLVLLNEMTCMSFFVQLIGIAFLWLPQKYFTWTTKAMLMIDSCLVLCAIIWGFVGIWTPHFGYKNLWEIWLWQAWLRFLPMAANHVDDD